MRCAHAEARSLEGAQPMRRQLVRPPDALHRAQRESHRRGHRAAGPMGHLVRRFAASQGHHLGRFIGGDRRLAGLAGLVAQQTLDPRFGKALLPAPHRRPTDADALGNPLGRPPIRRGEPDASPRHMLLPLMAVGHDRRQRRVIGSKNNHTYRLSHGPISPKPQAHYQSFHCSCESSECV
jgi:hypothetical protein